MNSQKSARSTTQIAIIGAGPAGLMAADKLSQAGLSVTVYDRMPSPARKFLMAGRGGLNLTHAEALDLFLDRYGPARDKLEEAIRAFSPDDLRAFAHDLGQETFIGSSGRIFPEAMKASPFLRAWLSRLNANGVRFALRHDWQGWDEAGALRFVAPGGEITTHPDCTLLALGGASWPKLGADGRFRSLLAAKGVSINPFRPTNVGIRVTWSALLKERYAGTPLKRIALSCMGRIVKGEAMLTRYGLEGGAVYALSREISDAIETHEKPYMACDFRPDMPVKELDARLNMAKKSDSFSNRLRKAAGLSPVAIALLHEDAARIGRKLADYPPIALSKLIKACHIPIEGVSGLERAISSAGGVQWGNLTPDFELKALPGVFLAGEMIDWDAPTGGYLLQACFSTGHAAAQGVLRYLKPDQ